MYETLSHTTTDSDGSLSARCNLVGSIRSGKQLVDLAIVVLQPGMAHHPVQLEGSSNWPLPIAVSKSRIMPGVPLGRIGGTCLLCS